MPKERDKISQVNILYNLLLDGEPHRTDEIQRVVYGSDHLGLCRVASRVTNIRQEKCVEVIGWHDHEHFTLYWYAIIPFEFKHLYEEQLKLGADKERAYFAARTIYRELQTPRARSETVQVAMF